MERKNTAKLALVNLVFLILTLVVNSLGAFGLINGLSQKVVSDRYPTLITPAPSAFSIWSVIYVLLFVSLIMMLLKKNDPYYQEVTNGISGLFLLSCILNMAWIVAFSYEQIIISAIFIFAFLITLTAICRKLLKMQGKRKILLPVTFGLYTGWLLIATVVNISASLVKVKWNGFGIADTVWADAVLIIALVLTFLILSKLQNAVFPLPLAWAYFWIFQALKSLPEGSGNYGTLGIISLIGMVILLIMAIVQFVRNHFSVLPSEI